jgi:hypothetical protein
VGYKAIVLECLIKSCRVNGGRSEQRIAELETGILKAHLTLNMMQNVFTDPGIIKWREKLKKILDYPGAPWKTSYRCKILEKEINYGIKLLSDSIRSPVLKLLHDFLVASRDGNIYGYYQQMSKDAGGLIINFSFESNKQTGDLPMRK